MGIRIYTGGTFDCFHWGHAELLKRLKEMAGTDGVVIVSLNTDEFIEEYKKQKPIMSYKEREAVLLSCKYVDLVVPNIGGADSKPAILAANANLIAIGSDWLGKDYMKQMSFSKEWLEDHNIGLAYIPYTKGISTTEIKKRINN